MVSFLPALAASLAMSVGSAAALPADGEVDRVVAIIRPSASAEPKLITLSRLEEETRIALVSRGGLLAASEPLDAPALRAGLEWLVDETLVIGEAMRLQVFDADTDDVSDQVARFRGQFPRPSDYQAFLGRWDISEEDVVAVLRRMSGVRRYIDSRVSHAAQVSEGEVSAWLDEHTAEIGTRDREVARSRLIGDRVSAETKALVRELRARAQVRLLAEPSSTEAMAPY